ncbi:MAG: tRNA (adenosine(37)-N6)-dimethylallyltransferase MiaA [Candidatus Omnitrophica bacterium]|nr:tRNA (adenosine(37)-N6)-dimethylallyltransferase MiaA [Candidatus Omnitrophota bacterium]
MKKPRENTVIFIVGPTAIGKTSLAIKLAKKIRGEIISCDSMQVYRKMGILSQAPAARERKSARHHLVGILDPGREYSAASFKKRAYPLVDSIFKRGKVPIIAGGSGLYAKALIDGLFPSPPADLKFRAAMRDYAGRYGSEKLYAKLAKSDPGSAILIHPNDIRRVIRALEILRSTGRTMTELKSTTKGLKDRYCIKIFGFTAPRQKIYAKINARVDKMFRAGAVAEVKKLSGKRLSKTAAAILGLREIRAYLKGERGLDETKEAVKMNTRRFAKRQLTWFRSDPRIEWIDVTRVDSKALLSKICHYCEQMKLSSPSLRAKRSNLKVRLLRRPE